MNNTLFSKSKRPLLGDNSNSLVMLIAINAVVFILLNFLRITYALAYETNPTAEMYFTKQILDWFTLPAQLEKLFTRPWTMLVYMFTNYSVWALISNLLWLWGFGYILQDMAGNKKLFPIYLYGGFVGAIFFLLSANLVPYLYQNIATQPALIGGGAAVMAVAVATTTLAPDYRIFPMLNGGIPLWVLTVIFVAIDFASVAGTNGAVAIAHLAGASIGFIFIKQMGKGKDWGIWMYNFVDWVNDLFNPEKKHKTQSVKHFYKTEKPPFTKTSNLTQQRLDEILDKINQHGYPMLTDEEKAFLSRASKEEL